MWNLNNLRSASGQKWRERTITAFCLLRTLDVLCSHFGGIKESALRHSGTPALRPPTRLG